MRMIMNRKSTWLLAAALGMGVCMPVVSGQDVPAPAEQAAPTEESVLEQVKALLKDAKLDEAAEKLVAYEPAEPAQSREKGLLMRRLMSQATAAGNLTVATKIGDTLLAQAKENVKETGTAGDLQTMLMMSTSLKVRNSDMETAAKWLKSEYEQLVEMTNEKNQVALLEVRASIMPILANYMNRSGMAEEATKLADTLISDVTARFATLKGEDKVRFMTSYVTLMLPKMIENAVADGEESSAAIANFLEEISAAGDLKTNSLLLGASVRARSGLASGIAGTNPEQAVALLDSAFKLLDDADLSSPGMDGIVAQSKRNIDSMKSRMEQELNRAKLIGQPAFALDIDKVVNGDAITDDDLKGKVVLLDFWAVWCGPCIATFPHLREWQEEFGDKGLVILGVTRNYGYKWDEEANRAVRGEEVSPEEEEAMLVKFAQQYELKHRFILTPTGSEFNKNYQVSGIPQAVLIDQSGNIRMIKVGSGEANAKALDDMIKELLGTTTE